MKILAIDGAFGTFSCAVRIDARVAAHERVAGGATLEGGLSAIHRALEISKLEGNDVDRIAVCTGPGSFTGLRIGISFAKSLAQGWHKPLVGVDAFDLLEVDVLEIPRVAILNPRQGIVSARLTAGPQQFRRSGSTASVCVWVAECSPERKLTAIGAPKDVLDGLGERGKLVHNLPAPEPALALLELAKSRHPARSIHEVRPDYGELPAVRPYAE